MKQELILFPAEFPISSLSLYEIGMQIYAI